MTSTVDTVAADILNPEQARLLPDSQSAHQEPVWQDFSKVDLIRTPEYMEIIPPVEPPPPSPGEVELSITLEESGVPSIELDQFTEELRAAVITGIKAVLDKTLDIHGNSVEYDSSTTIYKVEPGGGQWDIGKIWRGYWDALPADMLAELMSVRYYLRIIEEGTLIRVMHPFFQQIKAAFAPTGDGQFKKNLYAKVHEGDLSGADLTPKWQRIIDHLKEWSDYSPTLVITVPATPEEAGLGDSLPAKEPPEYDFELFEPGTVNLGLRTIYRQEWRALGNLRGEVVRTLPLGPKQTEKITTKITRKSSRKTGSSRLKSSESSTETSDTVKDSSEILQESQEDYGTKMSLDASFGVPQVQGISMGIEQHNNATETARDTSTSLSEAVQKTANKIKQETKVSVETESESGLEVSTSSEIHNPNEEIAITYVYSKLLRRYEVMTSLAEVTPVILIAEDVPQPHEIDSRWVRKHDWIINKALLDESFREAIASISEEVTLGQQTALAKRLDVVLDKTLTNLGSFAEASGEVSLSDIDIVEESQRGFREVMKENQQRELENRQLLQKRERLFEHIRNNILHYCRAIWSHEDNDQRLLRYRKRGITVERDWILDLSAATLTDIFAGLAEAKFVAGSEHISVADIINPAGPIGYHANYAMYYLLPNQLTESLRGMLDFAKWPYADEPLLYDAAGKPVLDATGNHMRGDVQVLDPVLREYRDKYPPSDVPEAWLTEEVRNQMMDYLPLLEQQVASGRIDFDSLPTFRFYYAEFMYRKAMSRRFVIDTNNLVLDIERGTGSALESFKLAHRSLDVQKAEADRQTIALENQRREALLAASRLGDPDIDNVTVNADAGDVNVDGV